MAVSTPRRRMLMQIPAKGSPFLRRTSRMSPTLAASGLALLKREVRAPVGSRTAIWEAWREAIGSLKLAAGEGGGGNALIFLLTGVVVR
jgi:hypothetical protein